MTINIGPMIAFVICVGLSFMPIQITFSQMVGIVGLIYMLTRTTTEAQNE